MSDKVVCAAIRNAYGELILGVRHFDELMHAQIKARPFWRRKSWRTAEQGFVDAHGKWMARKEAMVRAIQCGQSVDIAEGCGGDSKTLYSEGLY